MASKTYKISGMDCDACAKMIELDLEDVGVSAKCSYASKTLEITNSPEDFSEKALKQQVAKSGYKLEKN